MNGWRGIAAGALTLVVLQRLVATLSGTNAGAVGRVTGLLALPAEAARKFLDPTVPALHKKGQGAKASSSTPAKPAPAVGVGGAGGLPAGYQAPPIGVGGAGGLPSTHK